MYQLFFYTLLVVDVENVETLNWIGMNSIWKLYLFCLKTRAVSRIKLFQLIDPSPGVWLTGDLTNHNTKSAILSDKQIRQ